MAGRGRPALQLADADSAAAWFAGYVRTYLERDLQVNRPGIPGDSRT